MDLLLGKMPVPLVDEVLARLKIEIGQPDVQQLHKLITAYVRTVPWESAFRIVKKAKTAELNDCPRWPVEFWRDHLDRGGGGTCFESNYAFFALLKSQGFEGYLTINDMADSIGCHTAIIVRFGAQKWLVDAGFPIYAPLPVFAGRSSVVQTPFMDYSVDHLGADRYQIERRPHPKEDAFTLIDKPVSEDTYRQATTADYLPQGHFLMRVILHKIIDEQAWRFNSEERPYCLQLFKKGKRSDFSLNKNLVNQLAEKFDMDDHVLGTALALIGTDRAII